MTNFFRTLIFKQKENRKTAKKKKLLKNTEELANQIKKHLSNCRDEIPVLIISYNNGLHVANMVKQLREYKIKPIIIDNNSSDKNTQSILLDAELNGFADVVYSNKNYGHLVGFMDPIYKLLPETFAYTDPDLQLNTSMPSDFIYQLKSIAERFNTYKAGLALGFPEECKTSEAVFAKKSEHPFFFEKSFSILEWEARFWKKPLMCEGLEVYSADIDTTFAVYRKSNYAGNFYDAVRVAGIFAAVHLPWFPDLDILSEEDRLKYLQGNTSSTWI